MAREGVARRQLDVVHVKKLPVLRLEVYFYIFLCSLLIQMKDNEARQPHKHKNLLNSYQQKSGSKMKRKKNFKDIDWLNNSLITKLWLSFYT